jgi:hypothetical protein
MCRLHHFDGGKQPDNGCVSCERIWKAERMRVQFMRAEHAMLTGQKAELFDTTDIAIDKTAPASE